MRYQPQIMDTQFIADKFINELMSREEPGLEGGGAVDFVKYLTGVGFVSAVKICLEVAEAFGRVL